MATVLTKAEQNVVHNRCRANDLYRQWAPILSKLQRDYEEMDGASLWHLAEQKIDRLRRTTPYREQEIPVIYNELIDDCRVFSQKGKDNCSRTPEQARRTATTVTCILLTMLLNAIKKDHEDEFFDNEPMCMAIADILKNDNYTERLMDCFFSRDTGYDGKKVIITPHDPMLEGTEDEWSLKQRAVKQVLEEYDLSNKAACAVIVSAHRKNWLKQKPTYKEACEWFGERWSKDSYIYVNKGQDQLSQEELNLADDRLEEALKKLKL